MVDTVIGLYGTRLPLDYLPELRKMCDSLSASADWQRWWKITRFDQLEVEVYVGSEQGYKRGDTRFRRKGSTLRARIVSLGTPTDFKTLGSAVVVDRDISQMLKACHIRYRISAEIPLEDANENGAEQGLVPQEADEFHVPEIFDPGRIILELHVPLSPEPVADASEYPYPWIVDVEEHLMELSSDVGGLEVLDDGEEVDDEYLFFIAGLPEADLLDVARKISGRPGVPRNTYAVLRAEDADFGEGEKLMLS